MDTETTRYLLSALIQSVAISWAVVISLFGLLIQGYNRVTEALVIKRRLSEKDLDSYIQGSTTIIFFLYLLSMFALLTIAFGTVAFITISDGVFSESWVNVTVGFAIATFIILAVMVSLYLASLYVRIKVLRVVYDELKKSEKARPRSPNAPTLKKEGTE